MVLLEMNHVKKSFDGNGVLKDISLKVNEGEVVSIIGHITQMNHHIKMNRTMLILPGQLAIRLKIILELMNGILQMRLE